LKRFKALVAYDGTDYHGWQNQASNNIPTIEQTIINSFVLVFKTKISLKGASRTDAGVHANNQVISFYADLDLNTNKIKYLWNLCLPLSIKIKKIVFLKNKKFEIFKDVEHKTYYYYFSLIMPNIINSRFVYFYNYKIDIDKLNKALNVFIGKHDFRSFCTGDERENTIREIYLTEVKYIKSKDIYKIVIRGNKFLKYMVRRLVGAALKVASYKDLTIDYLVAVLKEKDPRQALPTAPAIGLVLNNIKYK